MFAVDTHVHLYGGHDAERLFHAAARHAADAARRIDRILEGLLLCLTEGADAGAFEALARGDRGLRVAATGEPVSLRVDGFTPPIFLIRGRQIVSREGLEALAIGWAAPWADRELALGDLVARIVADGGWAIVPWGAGKWWGRRGAVLRALLERPDGPPYALGDNGGRPWFWPRPRPFALAAARGRAILPGSDPLPIRGEESTAGRCLAVCGDPLDMVRPAACLVRALAAGRCAPLSPGGREKLWRFVRNQFLMQRRKSSRP